MDERLKDILDGDYKFVLIQGDYFDCPSCNDTTSFYTTTCYDEKELLKIIEKDVGSSYLRSIWVLDHYNTGDMVKYCDITTKTGSHQVQEIEFQLPVEGHIILVRDNQSYRRLTPAETVLRGKRTNP